jgi:hypothetical protein
LVRNPGIKAVGIALRWYTAHALQHGYGIAANSWSLRFFSLLYFYVLTLKQFDLTVRIEFNIKLADMFLQDSFRRTATTASESSDPAPSYTTITQCPSIATPPSYTTDIEMNNISASPELPERPMSRGCLSWKITERQAIGIGIFTTILLYLSSCGIAYAIHSRISLMPLIWFFLTPVRTLHLLVAYVVCCGLWYADAKKTNGYKSEEGFVFAVCTIWFLYFS